MCPAGVNMRSTAWPEIGQGFLDDRASPHKSHSRVEGTAQPLPNSTKGSISVPSQRMSLKSKCSAGRRLTSVNSMSCEEFTKLAQSSGPENIAPGRPLLSLLAPRAVLSPTRITLENNGKIRPEPDRENAFARASGGGGGIRTHGRLPYNGFRDRPDRPLRHPSPRSSLFDNFQSTFHYSEALGNAIVSEAVARLRTQMTGDKRGIC